MTAISLRIPPPAYLFCFAFVMWGVCRWLHLLTFSFPGAEIFGVALVVAGIVIDIVSVGYFLHARTTINPLTPNRAEELVIRGFNRVSRNPMYLGMFIAMCGWLLYLGCAENLVFLPLFVWVITQVQILPEENALREKFGHQYDEYCVRVRRWL